MKQKKKQLQILLGLSFPEFVSILALNSAENYYYSCAPYSSKWTKGIWMLC